MLQVFYCRKCKTNVFERDWQADKRKCKRCATQRRNKYNASKVERDGIIFDSQKEANQYFALQARQRAGEIANLQRQPRFDIIVNGTKIATYIADAQYDDLLKQKTIIEDTKSNPTRTPVYRLKKKLVEALYGISITEV
jgi:shikimate 5-dehydrogenase